MEIGEKIKSARKDKRMTQQTLADKMNVSKSTVSKWESGTNMPNVKMITDIADILDKPLNYFASDSWMSSLDDDEVAYLPILDKVTCLHPLLTTENVKLYRKRLREVIPKHVSFIVINEDDAVTSKGAEVMMIESDDAPDDYMVGFIDELGQKPLLRKIKHVGEQVMFYADNPQYPPIIKEKGDANIIGLAKRIIIDL